MRRHRSQRPARATQGPSKYAETRAAERQTANGAIAVLALAAWLASFAVAACTAAADELPIEVVEPSRFVLAEGGISLCEPGAPACGEPTTLEDGDEKEASAETFDEDVSAQGLLQRPDPSGEGAMLCVARQRSVLGLASPREGSASLSLDASGSSESRVSVFDPEVRDSHAHCQTDSYSTVSFRLVAPAAFRLVASLETELVAGEVFAAEPPSPEADPLVGAPVNVALATLWNATDADPLDPQDRGVALFDAVIFEEGETDDPALVLGDGEPSLGTLDEQGILEPGVYEFEAGTATRTFGFENGEAWARASYDVTLTVTVPEPEAGPGSFAAAVVAAGIAGRRRRSRSRDCRSLRKRESGGSDDGRGAYRKGVPIAFGTDTGVSAHGDNAREFVYMVEAGMPALEAIQSATWTAAEVLEMRDRLGSLEVGKLADLVAVPGDPSQDIEVMLRPGFVMKGGVIYAQP